MILLVNERGWNKKSFLQLKLWTVLSGSRPCLNYNHAQLLGQDGRSCPRLVWVILPSAAKPSGLRPSGFAASGIISASWPRNCVWLCTFYSRHYCTSRERCGLYGQRLLLAVCNSWYCPASYCPARYCPASHCSLSTPNAHASSSSVTFLAMSWSRIL